MSQGLFKETALKPDYVICTLMSFDERYPRLIDLYVEHCTDDPSEYQFAIEVFGNWEFWTNIRDKEWFKSYYEAFKAEAEVKRKSIAFKVLMDEAEKGGTSGINAAKFLIQEPWKEKTGGEKATKKNTTRRAADDLSGDFKRLRDLGLLGSEMDTPKH